MITGDGKSLGVLTLAEALAKARAMGLDLIEIAPTANPPVAKIMDFGKFKYERERGEREHRPKKTGGEVKSIRIGFKTGKHDLEVRALQAKKFLERGDMVNVLLALRGREKAHRPLAQTKFQEFLKLIPIDITLDGSPRSIPQGILGMIRRAS
ncbi:MAG: translation initiation factor IF-3 [Candidatus Sungbacteria bacterium]|uniref:Translation initiation factor IF-3 n=1 Tax=Candidatus Sungiibacteriota bacterium TaxID=2750080 RepID=A0A9D6LQA3_9BACT|nr:translation initiation factor IF-3 [Candidatus Sungbacteria bacterium]